MTNNQRHIHSLISFLSREEADLFIGEDAQDMRGVLSLRRPVANGQVRHWDEWLTCMDETERLLGAPFEEHPMLITAARFNPSTQQEKLVTELFEHYNVPALYVAPPSLLALYASGRNTGVVVGCGDGLMHCDTIAHGIVLPTAAGRVNLGGRNCTETLSMLLRENGYSLGTTSGEREIVRDIKERHAFVALDYNRFMKRAQRHPDDFQRSYELPDGQVIKTGDALFRCTEGIFQPSFFGSEAQGIHRVAFDAIQETPRDTRREMFANILLAGGTTLCPGFAERLQKEIDQLLADNSLLTVKAKVIATPERKFSTWIGGGILTTWSTFDQCWITNDEYYELGAAGCVDLLQKGRKSDE